ncbi:hypothetical protein BDV96DRAFT_641850 [Lophiotrema nucula]|uniref:J domain-containing protein n=1 Tax=Lophiotrema nucula TaxID=690887 RepID=A0A6A5ZLW0_9PLEO|nr:hypothetical protein BDV96DRAFT_641850 [Lophiotrema nucula]
MLFSSSSTSLFTSVPPPRKGDDHYATLNLPRNASDRRIRTAFFRLTQNASPKNSLQHKIRAAYGVLRDPKSRAEYDHALTEYELRRWTKWTHPELRFRVDNRQWRYFMDFLRAWGYKPWEMRVQDVRMVFDRWLVANGLNGSKKKTATFMASR